MNCGAQPTHLTYPHLSVSDATLCSAPFRPCEPLWKVTASMPITMEFEHITTDKATLKRECLNSETLFSLSHSTAAIVAHRRSDFFRSVLLGDTELF